jgi:hypothetical protein
MARKMMSERGRVPGGRTTPKFKNAAKRRKARRSAKGVRKAIASAQKRLWKEAEHPRIPKGTRSGGRFRMKHGSRMKRMREGDVVSFRGPRKTHRFMKVGNRIKLVRRKRASQKLSSGPIG